MGMLQLTFSFTDKKTTQQSGVPHNEKSPIVKLNLCKGEIHSLKTDVKTAKMGWMSQNEMKEKKAGTSCVVSILGFSNEITASEILSSRHKIRSCVSRFPSSFLSGFHFI